jgi:hypothetical protein
MAKIDARIRLRVRVAPRGDVMTRGIEKRAKAQMTATSVHEISLTKM